MRYKEKHFDPKFYQNSSTNMAFPGETFWLLSFLRTHSVHLELKVFFPSRLELFVPIKQFEQKILLARFTETSKQFRFQGFSAKKFRIFVNLRIVSAPYHSKALL